MVSVLFWLTGLFGDFGVGFGVGGKVCGFFI